MTMEVINPATGQIIKTYDELTPEEVSHAIEKSHEAFVEWRKTGFPDRAVLVKGAAEALRENRDEYATLMAQEMGKPVKDGLAEVEKCAWCCDYYAENAERFLRQEPVDTDASRSFITFQPLGVVLAVMPWNFPFWQVIRFAAPALMAGNAGILKHASNVPGSALAIEEIFRKAGFPDNLFRTLLIGSRQVDSVIEHPLVKAVTLTGSMPAGRAVARNAGEVLRKSVLELGGSDQYIILEEADLEMAVNAGVESRLVNSGQSGISAKRVIVVETVRDT